MHFDDEFDELAALAYRTAFRILGDRGDAEDVAQETLTKALVHWQRVGSHARPWVCRVAANHAIGMLRRARRRGRIDTALASGETRTPDSPIERVDLQRALLRLSPRQREVLALRYLAGFTEAEVSVELGINVGTVKTHAHRALAELRRHIGPRQEAHADV